MPSRWSSKDSCLRHPAPVADLILAPPWAQWGLEAILKNGTYDYLVVFPNHMVQAFRSDPNVYDVFSTLIQCDCGEHYIAYAHNLLRPHFDARQPFPTRPRE